jgi:putative membrane protein
MWWHGDLSWWAWLIMGLGLGAFWGWVIWAAVTILRGRRDAGPARQNAQKMLAEWLAHGEIDEEEYQERVQALRATAPGEAHHPRSPRFPTRFDA